VTIFSTFPRRLIIFIFHSYFALHFLKEDENFTGIIFCRKNSDSGIFFAKKSVVGENFK